MPHIRRMRELVHELLSEMTEQQAAIREFVGKSVKILGEARPDTFLGRKTQEPFPKEEDEK